LIPGDNIVWQLDDVKDYVRFVEPYCESALQHGKSLVYLRFASHAPLVREQPGVVIHHLNPSAGFESFIANIHKVIETTERGAWYVFDCLSELAYTWSSDTMLGNFFLLTCPYLYDVGALAFFGLVRHAHAPEIIALVTETTQVFLDVYSKHGQLYVHPIKVQQRHSPTMYMLHAWEGDDFLPVGDSATIAELLSAAACFPRDSNRFCQGIWHGTFLVAEELLESRERGEDCAAQLEEVFLKLLRMVVTRSERMLQLVRKYLTVEDIIAIGRRIVGTGLIGGKSIGMLVSRAILKDSDPKWNQTLEPHDTFYIGSDVFYTYLVQNGLWWKCQRHRDPEHFLEGADQTRQRILVGKFPEHVLVPFQSMLDYFGQSPIIVRSSSLLEDNFGHSFAGKYESIFLANQGSREQRLHDFISAVRTIYASTLSEEALNYRSRRGMLEQDEQMALLVQRVSGMVQGTLFYPHVAGVGFSYNPYVWSKEIDPHAGVLRLVYGLGTRAVDRMDDDYTRLVALNAPDRKPVADLEEAYRYAQKRVDVLDLQANQLVTENFSHVVQNSMEPCLDLVASIDESLQERASGHGATPVFAHILTFDGLIDDTDYVSAMKGMLRSLEEAYGCPVDVEFTTNFTRATSSPEKRYRINVVQCRPLQVKGEGSVPPPPDNIAPEDLLLEANGAVIGQSRQCKIDRIIQVVPSVYGQMTLSERYSLARLIGRLMHLEEEQEPEVIMLIGPGRWGTSTPSLGVPVKFGEINNVSVLTEMVEMRDDLVPDVSLGTHFFNELVEADILYLALFPGKEGNKFNKALLESSKNRLSELLPDAEKWSNVIRVIDPESLILNANALTQCVVCYLNRTA